jgi:ABC-type amino acid transport substrate-binding protein
VIACAKPPSVTPDASVCRCSPRSSPPRRLPIDEVGPLFEKRRYGIGVPTASPLRHRLNIVLAELAESGAIDKLYAKYFGN